jgi:magnesium-transporting ATPase (P-type)
VILFSFFKNITLVLTLFYYNFFNGFSGRGMYEDWMYVNFNAFTFFPCLVLGILDVDFKNEMVQANPQLYITSREQRNLNNLETAKAIAFSIITSARLEANTEITIRVHSRYPVEGFQGTKSIVLYSGQGLRHNNTYLSILCFVLSCFCAVFAAIIRCRMYSTTIRSGNSVVVPLNSGGDEEKEEEKEEG